jgi:hypothetical protein
LSALAESSGSAPAATVPFGADRSTPRAIALRFVVLLGIVSMLSDMTHEGARSITGPFLGTLGANGAIVAIVAGGGEFVGYALRFVSGYAADRTRRYWPITLFGYAAQMLAVPLLALAGRWPIAALLIVAERAGRAVRNPPRDAMLAHATGELGAGPEEAQLQGSRVLAYGETTGHTHKLEGHGQVWRQDTRLYLTLEQPSTIVHEQHRPLTLHAGIYEVIGQREYLSPEEDRRVFD